MEGVSLYPLYSIRVRLVLKRTFNAHKLWAVPTLYSLFIYTSTLYFPTIVIPGLDTTVVFSTVGSRKHILVAVPYHGVLTELSKLKLKCEHLSLPERFI